MKSQTPKSIVKNNVVNSTEFSRRDKRYGTYIGHVIDSKDIQRMGRLRLWIPELGSDKSDPKNHVIASYGSPFAGVTPHEYLASDGNKTKRFEHTQTSYGFWAIPPDVGVQVLVTFINGDSSRAVWFACLYEQNMNHMVPGIAANRNYQTDHGEDAKISGNWNTITGVDDKYHNSSAAIMAPTAEYNKFDKAYDISKKNVVRPWHKIQTEKIGLQGLLLDGVRGIHDASARREDTSQVFGFLTPGPEIKEFQGHRAGGNSFIMDDRTGSECIRFRTRSGAQLKIDETNGIIYAINRDGTAWIEMTEDGHFFCFTEKSYSVRALGDINFKSGNNINFEAENSFNVKTLNNDIKLESAKDYHLHVSNNTFLYSGNNVDIKNAATLKIDVGGAAHIKTGSTLNVQSGGQMGIKAGGNLLQTAPQIHLNGPDAGSAQAATEAIVPETEIKVDVFKSYVEPKKLEFSNVDPFNYIHRKAGTLNTIVSKMPTYEPSPVHAGSSGDKEPVKVENGVTVIPISLESDRQNKIPEKYSLNKDKI